MLVLTQRLSCIPITPGRWFCMHLPPGTQIVWWTQSLSLRPLPFDDSMAIRDVSTRSRTPRRCTRPSLAFNSILQVILNERLHNGRSPRLAPLMFGSVATVEPAWFAGDGRESLGMVRAQICHDILGRVTLQPKCFRCNHGTSLCLDASFFFML